MARARYSHNSFSVGVLSQKVLGNTEFEGYNNSLKECVNMQVQHTGGLFKRGGTKFVAKAKSPNAKLVLFSYNTENQYMCEFGEKYIRFHTLYGSISKDGKIYELLTDFDKEDVKGVKHFQDGNALMLITQKGMFKLTRTNTDTFQLDEMFYTAEPLTFPNSEQIALKVSGVDGDITITAVDPKDTTKKPAAKYTPVFFNDDYDHYIVLSYTAVNTATQLREEQRFYLKIFEVNADTDGFNKCVCRIDKERSHNNQEKLPTQDVVTRWSIGAFTATRGLPKAAEMFEGRLFLANNSSFPTGIWGSATLYGDCTDFYLGSNDADAVQHRFQSKYADDILWLAAQGKLFAGTAYGVFICGAATYNDEAISPSNFSTRLCSRIGASDLQPVAALDSVFFVDHSGKNVHEIVLSAETGTYTANDLSLLGGDLTSSGIIAHAWQQTPIKTYWCAVNDGHLCALTYLKNNGITAWTKHEIGGRDAAVLDICTMNGDKTDYLWLLVKRAVGNSYEYYVEYMMPPYDPLSQEEFKQYYVDCGRSFEDKYPIASLTEGSRPRLSGADNATSMKDILVKSPHCNLLLLTGDLVGDLYHGYFVGDDGPYLSDYTTENDKKPVHLDRIPHEDKNGTNFDAYCRITEFRSGIVLFYNYAPTNLYMVFLANVNAGEILLVAAGEKYHPDKVFQIKVEKVISPKQISVRLPGPSKFEALNSKAFALYRPYGQGAYSVKYPRIQIKDIPGKDQEVYINKVPGAEYVNGRKIKIKHLPEESDENEKSHKFVPLSEDGSIMFADGRGMYDTAKGGGNAYAYFSEVDASDFYQPGMEALCDGTDVITARFDGTKIKFAKPVMYASVGLPYKGHFDTTSFEGGSMFGASVGLAGTQKTMFMRLYYSLGGKYGPDANNVVNIPYTDFVSDFTKKRTLISGIVKCPIENGHDIYSRSIHVEHAEPLAFNVLSITQDVQVSDG